MTEGCEEKDSLVRVRAQVMTRDDSSGGWVPMDGGGLSNVSVRKRILPIAIAVSVNAATSPASGGGGHHHSASTTPSGPGPPPSPGLTPAVCHFNNTIQHEYLILGKRISDQTVVLSCTIRKDFQYNKVMPTFHHWRTGDQKFGLTFQTAADARAFDKGVRMAVEDLLDELADPPALRHLNSDASEDDVFMTLDLPMERSELQNSPSLSHYQQPQPAPGHTLAPSPAPPSMATSPSPTPAKEQPHLHRIQFMQRKPPPLSTSTSSLPLLSNNINEGSVREHSITPDQLMWQQRDQELAMTRERERATKEKERQRRERESIWSGNGDGLLNDHIELDKESYSYVQFAREGTGIGNNSGGEGGLQALHSLHSLHEYSYPVMPDPASKVVSSGGRRDSLNSLKKAVHPMTSVGNNTSVPMLPNKGNRSKKKRRGSNSSASSTKMSISHLHPPAGKGMGRLRCKHCQDTFRPEENGRGACEYAPDCVRSTIDAVSCVSCAQCLLYHCYADAEGDFTPQPCACSCSNLAPNGGGGGGGSGRRHHHGCCIDSSPKRWFGLALLSLVVPCLWCYLPLRACYRCGVQCGCCGKPHEAA